MTKILLVEECFECPFFREQGSKGNYCTKEDASISLWSDKIPNWCPLKDVNTILP